MFIREKITEDQHNLQVTLLRGDLYSFFVLLEVFHTLSETQFTYSVLIPAANTTAHTLTTHIQVLR